MIVCDFILCSNSRSVLYYKQNTGAMQRRVRVLSIKMEVLELACKVELNVFEVLLRHSEHIA